MKGLFFCAVALVATAFVSAGNETECALSGGFAPGSPDSPDYRKYAPDRRAGIEHLALDVALDFTNRTVSGTATWTFRPIAEPLTELTLDGIDLEVIAVKGSQAVAAHQVTTEHVTVTFAKPIPTGERATVSITYRAHPKKGLYFRTPELGFAPEDLHVWTQGEPDEARHWYPCYDYPNQKFTTEVTCRAPAEMVVLSNGRQVSETATTNGWKAVTWRQEKPMANYLVALIVGRLKAIEDRHGKVPLHFWTPASEIAYASNSFADTKPAMEFFEQEIGVPYPWDKYDQVCIQDYHWGGMENTSLTTLNVNSLYPPIYENARSSQGLIAHELAHQWFGDFLTCKDWSHIWLNEGFATFYDLLYTEHKQGRDEFIYRLREGLKTLTAQTNLAKSIVWRKYDKPSEQFDGFAYGKGSYVLHMLREQLGPELYRRCISTYVKRHQLGSVVTEDLRAVIEELSGRSYDQFFDQWVYHAGFPVLDVDYSWDENAKLAKISVRQTQAVSDTVPLFNFPLPVRFTTKAGVVTKTLAVKQKSEDFTVALDSAPTLVRIDPSVSVLAKINFKPTTAMLALMLTDASDVGGRFLACEQLAERKDADTVARLKKTLNEDKYWGVRVAASKALRAIKTDEAFAALKASLGQKDARVRKQVVMDTTSFFRPEAFEQALTVLRTEKNPDIVDAALRSMDAATTTNARTALLSYLKSESWREHLFAVAASTMRDSADAQFVEPLRAAIAERGTNLPPRALATALDAVAYLAREEANKDAVRTLIVGFTEDKREAVRVAALSALGTLRDARALPVLERFVGAKEERETAAAEKAMEAIRASRKSATELSEVRKELLELQKQSRELRKEVDALKGKGTNSTTKGTKDTKKEK